MMPASTAEARLAELEEAYQEVKIRGPRAGVPVSAVVMVGVGLAAMAAGITGLAISTVRLKRAKQKRRYLKYQMEDLERALP
jgi:hypothetical protein